MPTSIEGVASINEQGRPPPRLLIVDDHELLAGRGPLGHEIGRLLQDLRAGVPRAEALRRRAAPAG